MKITMAGMAIVNAVFVCSAVTITFRDGRALVCDILAKDDTNLIVRTVKGVQTNAWRQLSPASFKVVHPELYARLLAEAKARQQQQTEAMKAKGMILVGGKWVDKKVHEMKMLERVRLNVLLTESVGKFERTDKGNGSLVKDYRRESCGVMKIKLDSLDHTRAHTLRVQYTCYVDTPYEDDIRKVDADKEVTKIISKQSSAEFELRTEPYYEYKEVLRGGWHYYRGGKSTKASAEIEGWDIRIWLNKQLVYQRTRAGKEQYHHLSKS
jgi:hypothetical protein